MKVSVALCTYNGEKFLKEQLDSILQQTRKVNEIIICDDGSTDSTMAILIDYQKEHPSLFTIHANEKNLRSLKNFEKAITLCTGAIIFLSDQDDIWTLNKVEDYLTFFENNPKINVLASNGYCIDEHSQVIDKYAIWDAPQFLREQNIPFDYFHLIAWGSNIATGASMALRKEILEKIMPFPEISGFHHDEWIALIASNTNSFELLNTNYFYYRIHQNQQVGSVFYEKNNALKTYLTDYFFINKTTVSFNVFKRKLRKLYTFCILCQTLINQNNKHKKSFAEKLTQTKAQIIQQRKSFLNRFPVKGRMLFLSDFIFNKRR